MASNNSSVGADEIKDRLAALEAFRVSVWGNSAAFKQHVTRESASTIRNVEYLDFGRHLKAVQLFCKAIKNERLLVIQEYRNAMETFKTDNLDYKNGACILGQPGIGKSSFIAYAVIERLRERQPVAVQVPWLRPIEKYILFSSEGVNFYDRVDVTPLTRHQAIWAFSDVDESFEIPTTAFTSTSGVRTFQMTSPTVKRRESWTKRDQINLYVMDLWSIEEIEDLLHVP